MDPSTTKKEKIYSDLCKRFSTTNNKINEYIYVMYIYDCKAIGKTATKNISDKEMICDFTELTIDLKSTLYEFHTGRGTGTATLESNIIQQFMALREEVLYGIFLYIHKSYYNLNRDFCLDTMAAYGVGPWSLRLLRQYWARLVMVARAGRYLSPPSRGISG